MAQRGSSKKAKGRKEEEELDRQLMAAGLLDDGMTLAQKRELAQILSFSVSSAQEEESQRKNREIEEEKIIEKTLDKSINVEKDLQDDSENSRGSDDIVIISGGPDSDSQASRSSQLSKGIIGLDRLQNTEKTSPHISQYNSDQDLFCDSQVGKQEHQKDLVTPVGEKIIEKSISTTSADSASENAHKSLENVQKKNTNVTSKRGIRKHPSADEMASPSAKALRRHATVHEVSSPSTKSQHKLGINEKVQSQPLFVSGSSNISVRSDKSSQSAVDNEECSQTVSPLIGVINGKAFNAFQNHKSSNVQESQISNSLEVVRLHPEKLNKEDDSSTDDEIFSSPVQSPSILQKASTPAGVISKRRLSAVSTPNTSNVNLRLSVSPGMSPAMEKSPVKSLHMDGEVNSLSISSASQNPVIKNQIEDDDVKKSDDDDATQEIVVTPSVSSTDKVLASSILEENILTHHSDKDSENSSDANDNCSYSINKKSFLKAFPLSKSDTEPLQRKNMRSEKRNLAYMKHENESVNESKKRIISLMDTSCNILENYQGSLGYRMKWDIPVSVDKRVKEWTLNRPLQIIRKILPTSAEEAALGIRRATRQTRKVRQQNQGGDSDDSLPDIIHNSQDSKLKPSSQRRSVGGKFSNNLDDKHRITNDDSDDDLDDFDIFPSKHSKQLGKTTVKVADSTPRKHPKSNQDVDYVSSSRLQDDVKTNSEEKNINFELNVNDSDNDNDKKHMSEENYINTPKRKPNDSFEQSRPIKRRKTFMLNVEEDEVASSSNISENVQQEEVMQSSLEAEVTSVVDGEERSKYFCDKNLKDEVGGLVSSQEQKKETNYVSSSYEESHDDVIPGPSSSSADLFILENTDGKTVNDKSTSSTTNTKGASKSQQRLQIRPGRLKIASRRNNGNRRDAPNEEGDQISSSLEQDTTDIDKSIKVECPLCAREFPQDKIEVHASTCNGQVDSTVEEVDERSLFQRPAENTTVKRGSNTEAAAAKEDTSKRRPIAATTSEKRPRIRTPPAFVRCYLCDEVFPEGDEYAIHVGSCDGQQKVVEGIKSPSSTASPRSWATKSMQRGAKQIQTYGTSTAILKKRSVFEQLEAPVSTAASTSIFEGYLTPSYSTATEEESGNEEIREDIMFNDRLSDAGSHDFEGFLSPSESFCSAAESFFSTVQDISSAEEFVSFTVNHSPDVGIKSESVNMWHSDIQHNNVCENTEEDMESKDILSNLKLSTEEELAKLSLDIYSKLNHLENLLKPDESDKEVIKIKDLKTESSINNKLLSSTSYSEYSYKKSLKAESCSNKYDENNSDSHLVNESSKIKESTKGVMDIKDIKFHINKVMKQKYHLKKRRSLFKFASNEIFDSAPPDSDNLPSEGYPIDNPHVKVNKQIMIEETFNPHIKQKFHKKKEEITNPFLEVKKVENMEDKYFQELKSKNLPRLTVKNAKNKKKSTKSRHSLYKYNVGDMYEGPPNSEVSKDLTILESPHKIVQRHLENKTKENIIDL